MGASHNLKIKGIDEAHASVYVDDNPVRCFSVNLDMGIDRMHSATIGLVTVPDVDIEAMITYRYTPDTIEAALKLVETELKRNNKDVFGKLVGYFE